MIITDDPEAIRRVLLGSKTIAVVGCSNKPDRDSYQIAQALIDRGYDVIPVNPGAAEILGRKCYPDVKSIPKKVDIVDVFRRAEETPAIADDAVAIGARALWLQLGISSEEAARRASDGGLIVVMDNCIGQTVSKTGVHARAES